MCRELECVQVELLAVICRRPVLPPAPLLRSGFCLRLFINLVGEMAQREVLGGQLHKRWKLTAAEILSSLAPRRKRRTRRQMRDVRRSPGNLIKLALFSRRIGNRTKQAFC